MEGGGGGGGELPGCQRFIIGVAKVELRRQRAARGVGLQAGLGYRSAGDGLRHSIAAMIACAGGDPREKLLEGALLVCDCLALPFPGDLDIQVLGVRQAQRRGEVDRIVCCAGRLRSAGQGGEKQD